MNSTIIDVTIAVYVKTEEDPFRAHLIGISDFLTSKGLVPNVGDIISMKKVDSEMLGISSIDRKNLLIVKQKLFNANYDVDIVCEYLHH